MVTGRCDRPEPAGRRNTGVADEIARGLARGRLRPIFDIDERNGDLLWEPWIDGLAAAIELLPRGWEAGRNDDDADVAHAWSRLFELVAIARGESALETR